MSSTNRPYTRPRKPLYDVIVTRWMTLTNFAWFLAAVLAGVLLLLAVKGAGKLANGDAPPYRLVAMSGVSLDMTLRDMETKNALVMLYDSTCRDCGKQISALLNLRNLQTNKELGIYIISLDDKPETTMRYLESIDLPESMVTYYAGGAERADIGRTLERIGSSGVDFRYPHSLLIGKGRKFIIEYKGYIRSQEIQRTIKLNNMYIP